ncbi:MAG: RNA polymerase sigma factor, partial [Planctomycetota bacterium JB042]
MRNETMDPEQLLSHRGFVRGLARRLLLDESRVDDVEQQTWVAALGGGPREPSRLRGWLAAVTRNFARRALRDEELRRRREAEAESPPPLPPAEEFLALEARRREVVEAVMRLDEPYRTVVLLRWFKELPPKAIARRLDLPVETVKTRLKRGHERLRLDLDARHGGDRAAWCAWLVPLVRPEGAAAGAIGAALSGATAMKATAAWVGGGIVAAAAVLVMMQRSGPEAPFEPR